MANDRIRLSERARKRLLALSDQADIEPSFLLEYLINRHGNEAIQALSGQQNNLVPVSEPNAPYQSSSNASVTSSDQKRDIVTQPALKAVTAVPHAETVDFASLIANA